MNYSPRNDVAVDNSHVTSSLRLLPVLLLLIALAAVSCAPSRREVKPEAPYGSRYAVASWYGPKFHGRPTSSGEKFNMYALTCAHKTLPFGQRVNVTLLSSGKDVDCVVNDRGPFIEGRDIDLSYGAAKEIGLIGPGVGKVLLTFRGRDESYRKKVQVGAAESAGPYAIQIGSFSDSTNAIRLKTALSISLDHVYIQEADVSGTLYYRVRIGNFNLMKDALSLAERLGDEGYPVLVVRADKNI